jgi:hypothetical protein
VFLDVFGDGPAAVAGIKPSDMLVALDGRSYLPPTMPRFQLGNKYSLTISTVHSDDFRTVAVNVPFRKAARADHRSSSQRAQSIGWLHQAWVGKNTILPDPTGLSFAKTLDAAIQDLKDHGCDSLIIDLRGNIGGSLGFARLASYLCPGEIPIGHSLTPDRLRADYDRQTLPRIPMPATRPRLLLTLAQYALRDKSVVLLTRDSAHSRSTATPSDGKSVD